MENYIEIIKIILYFIIYSFLGWVLESVYKSIGQRKLVNSGFLHGPFCPIYGFGAVIMFLFLNKFTNNIVLLFIMGFFILSIWEYIVGFILEKTFNTKYWDYSNNKFNIQGRVCLKNSLFWGALGVIFTTYIHPYIIQKVDQISENEIMLYTILLSIIIIVDMIISIVKVTKINIDAEQLKEITNTIKLRIEELETKQINRETLQQTIDELKYKQTRIKRKLLRRTNRLKKAFPTMKSDAIERINEFIKDKKESIKK